MIDPTEPTRYAFEYPDEAGYPDGKGTLSQDQIVLIDDEKVGIYARAWSGSRRSGCRR